MRNELNEINEKSQFQDAGKNSVSENLRNSAEIFRKTGAFIPDPRTKIITETAGSFMELGAKLKEMLDQEKAEKEAKQKEVASEAGNMAGAGLSGEKKTNF